MTCQQLVQHNSIVETLSEKNIPKDLISEFLRCLDEKDFKFDMSIYLFKEKAIFPEENLNCLIN